MPDLTRRGFIGGLLGAVGAMIVAPIAAMAQKREPPKAVVGVDIGRGGGGDTCWTLYDHTTGEIFSWVEPKDFHLPVKLDDPGEPVGVLNLGLDQPKRCGDGTDHPVYAIRWDKMGLDVGIDWQAASTYNLHMHRRDGKLFLYDDRKGDNGLTEVEPLPSGTRIYGNGDLEPVTRDGRRVFGAPQGQRYVEVAGKFNAPPAELEGDFLPWPIGTNGRHLRYTDGQWKLDEMGGQEDAEVTGDVEAASAAVEESEA